MLYNFFVSNVISYYTFNVWPAVIAAAGALAGSKMGVNESARQRAWQENLRGDAYQVAKRDMKLAGLNPALMYGGGAGGAAMAGGSSFGGFENFGESAVNSALSSKRLAQEIALMDSNIRKQDEERAYIKTQRELTERGMPARIMGTEGLKDTKSILGDSMNNLLDKALPEAPGVGPGKGKDIVPPRIPNSGKSYSGDTGLIARFKKFLQENRKKNLSKRR